MGVLFLDLKKAFNTVDHRILVSRLSNMGLSPNSLGWVESYLYGRTQHTIVNNHKSSSGNLTCGVPQGSILGPLFFILYVNSLPAVLSQSSVFLYADDTAIAVHGENTDQILNTLNQELQLANTWFAEHKLSLNLKKTWVMFFGTHSKLPKLEDVRLTCNDTPIEATSTYKYLGVLLIVN